MMNTSVWHWWCFFQLSSKKYWGEFSTESIIVVSFGHNRHVTRDISLEEASLWIWSSNSIHCYLSRRKYWPKWPLWGVFYQRSRPMDVLWGRLISKSEKSGGSFLLWSWNTISMFLCFFLLLPMMLQFSCLYMQILHNFYILGGCLHSHYNLKAIVVCSCCLLLH